MTKNYGEGPLDFQLTGNEVSTKEVSKPGDKELGSSQGKVWRTQHLRFYK